MLSSRLHCEYFCCDRNKTRVATPIPPSFNYPTASPFLDHPPTNPKPPWGTPHVDSGRSVWGVAKNELIKMNNFRSVILNNLLSYGETCIWWNIMNICSYIMISETSDKLLVSGSKDWGFKHSKITNKISKKYCFNIFVFFDLQICIYNKWIQV